MREAAATEIRRAITGTAGWNVQWGGGLPVESRFLSAYPCWCSIQQVKRLKGDYPMNSVSMPGIIQTSVAYVCASACDKNILNITSAP